MLADVFKKMVLFIFLLFSSSNLIAASTPETGAKLSIKLQELLDNFLAENKSIPGITLSVHSETKSLNWDGVSGYSNIKNKRKLEVGQPWRIASITKTFTAAGIIRLIETNKIRMDDPIIKYISQDSKSLLEMGGYAPETITIRHLLAHTSGLPNFANSTEYFLSKVKETPDHIWSRSEQLAIAVNHMKSIGKPGELFAYSDTGYNLLGEVISEVMGEEYGPALRQLLRYHSLGLGSTWMELQETTPSKIKNRVHQYWNGADTYSYNPSMDLFGGGGLVSTLNNLSLFYYGLFNERVFEQVESVSKMRLALFPDKGGPQVTPYGLVGNGLISKEFSGYTVSYHTGYWGVWAGYIPGLDLAFAIGVNESEGAHEKIGSLLAVIITEINRVNQ